jgi:AcrR family transcriptional regulator
VTAPVETARRAPGRPRSEAADEAILQAVVELFAQVGLEGLTMEAVAARAGVGKGTVYRRYANKFDLVLSVVRAHSRIGEPPPETGSTRGDLRALLDDLVSVLTDTPVGRLLPILVAARTRVPELDAASAEITAEGRVRSVAVMRRGVERGDFRADVDVDFVVDAFFGAVFYRFLVIGAPLDDEFRAHVVEATMRAFGP